MRWENLSEQSRSFVDRYIRKKKLTREQALEEKIVQEVISEYENGTKEREVFI